MGIEDVGPHLGTFDTVLLLGVNFGLLADEARATERLGRFAAITSERGRVVAGSRDPHATDDPVKLDYNRRNQESGRLAGHHRLRVRYRNLATPGSTPGSTGSLSRLRRCRRSRRGRAGA
jgi:hypothetical protein